MTLGESRVRTKFNPSADSLVDQIKQDTARLIDLCNKATGQAGAYSTMEEEIRLWRLAMTHYETAAMYAVKAATTGK